MRAGRDDAIPHEIVDDDSPASSEQLDIENDTIRMPVALVAAFKVAMMRRTRDLEGPVFAFKPPNRRRVP